MANLILNKTAAKVQAINALMELAVRNSPCLDDVIVTPIAGAWPDAPKLPWYGSQYCVAETEGQVVQLRISEFGHIEVHVGKTLWELRFPDLSVKSAKLKFNSETPLDEIVTKLIHGLEGGLTTLMVTYKDSISELLEMLSFMSDHGLEGESLDQLHDLYEYQPAAVKHVRTLRIFLTGGMVLLSVEAYGINDIDIWFEPDQTLIDKLNELQGQTK